MPFHSLYSHGLVRVAACSPIVAVGDPAANVAEHLRWAHEAHREGAALAVFPELGISAYAIDDLLGQHVLQRAVEAALAQLVEASRELQPLLLVGAPLRHAQRLYNCAVAIHRGRVLGVVPKSYLPNYREYYEKRWFASGRPVKGWTITVAGQQAPFGTDLVFAAEDVPDFVVHAEVCEDMWCPAPPHGFGAMAGATVLVNLSASNITVGKADTREMLCRAASERCFAAFVYAAAGTGESTTDVSWDGQASVHELGGLLTATERFPDSGAMAVADVDVQRIALERLRTGTFNDAAVEHGSPEARFRRIGFTLAPTDADLGLRRPLDRFPFAPSDPETLSRDCYEAYNIQVSGLMQRMRATGGKRLMIGVSGGLDSTHALVVAAKAFDRLGKDRKDIFGFTLPGFATGDTTKGHAWALMNALGITAAEVDIKPLAMRLLTDLDHPYSRGEPVYDITFENVQAGVRTDFLFRAANRYGGMVLGTGDLSELALGWCTYGVGDHMSHYNVNAGVPKTLIQHLIGWAAETDFAGETGELLKLILASEISPELVPADAAGGVQSTEGAVGPYGLQDFTLYHLLRYGLPPSKIAFLQWHAWRDAAGGEWPAGYPETRRKAYDLPEIKRWMAVFLRRFFTQQYKRSALPNGPKVSAGGALSPRGDWRAPSDGGPGPWLQELEEGVPG